MRYRILADIVVVLHLLWILFLVTGAFWGRRNRAVMFVHGGGLLFAVVSQIAGWYCPLTHLEVWLRAEHALSDAYPGSFIIHYLENLIYGEVPPVVVPALTAALIGFNLVLYRGSLRLHQTQ